MIRVSDATEILAALASDQDPITLPCGHETTPSDLADGKHADTEAYEFRCGYATEKGWVKRGTLLGLVYARLRECR